VKLRKSDQQKTREYFERKEAKLLKDLDIVVSKSFDDEIDVVEGFVNLDIDLF
jgi:hypothetical protein